MGNLISTRLFLKILVLLVILSSLRSHARESNSDKLKYEKNRFHYLSNQMELNFTGDMKTALLYSDSLIQMSKELNNNEFLAFAYNAKSQLFVRKNLFDRAAEDLIKALEYANESGIPRVQLVVFNNYAALFLSMDHAKKAMEILNQMRSLIAEIDRPLLIASTYQNFGIIYESNDIYDSAAFYYESALNIYEQVKSPQINDDISKLFGNLGSLFHKQNKLEEAIENYRRGMELSQGFPHTKAGMHLNMGYALLAKSKFDSAYFHLSKGLNIGDSLAFIDIKSNAYRFLSQYYNTINEYELSNKYLNLLSQINDSFNGNKTQEKVWIIQLDYEQKQSKLKLENQKVIANYTIAFVLLIAIIILLLLNRRRLRHKKNQLIAQQKADLSNIKLEKIDLELKAKNQKLYEFASILKEKNILIEKFNNEIETLFNPNDTTNKVKQKNTLLKMKILTQEDWEKFKQLFEEVNEGFLNRLDSTYPDLTEGDKRQFLLIRLGFNRKETSEMMGISIDGAKKAKQRLSRKLRLKDSSLLSGFIAEF